MWHKHTHRTLFLHPIRTSDLWHRYWPLGNFSWPNAGVSAKVIFRLRFAAREIGCGEEGQKLCVDAVDAEIDRAADWLGERLCQLKRPLRIACAPPLPHERAEAIVVVLEDDRDRSYPLCDEHQFPRRQRLARQRFLGPIVVADDRADADCLDLREKLLVQLLRSVGAT